MKSFICSLSLALLLLYPLHTYSQDDDSSGGGGESAAEASVTGAASQPSSSTSGSVESNPVVSMVRSGIPIEAAAKIKISNIKKLASAGVNAFKVIAKQAAAGEITVEQLDSSVEKLDVSTLKGVASSSTSTLKQVLVDVAAGTRTASEVKDLVELGRLESASTDPVYDYLSKNTETKNNGLLDAATSGVQNNDTSLQHMALAVTWVDSLLTDRDIVTTLPSIEVNLDSLSGNHYTYELLRLLSNYGALGPNGDSFLNSYFGDSTTALSSTGSISNALPSGTDSTADFLPYLGALSGGRVFINEVDSETTGNDTVIEVPLKNVTLNASNTLDFKGGTIYLGDKLPKVVDSRGDDASPSDENIYIVGAAKDVKFTGDVIFENRSENGVNNIAEDHAFVVGAGDEFRLENNDLEFKGSNLAIGAGGKMWLSNTKITTGGNLAIGTLSELAITNADFNVGNANAGTSDPDNVYVYANELIKVVGLDFQGRVDDVYMEAVTLYLQDVVFPATAEVTLRSEKGSLHFINSVNDTVQKGVNFNNVKHLGISNDALTINNFDVSRGDGHINSKTGHLHADGTTTPWIRIRDQGSVAAGVN